MSNGSRRAGGAGRRGFLRGAAAFALAGAGSRAMAGDGSAAGTVTLFLCGDVMTGRGIDQVLPHPGSPRLYEPYLNSAAAYV
jgi:poly-gamma-glutamate synthesis protein (capsule biosynthesis protein)